MTHIYMRAWAARPADH